MLITTITYKYYDKDYNIKTLNQYIYNTTNVNIEYAWNYLNDSYKDDIYLLEDYIIKNKIYDTSKQIEL